MTHDDRPSNIYGRKFEAHASGGVEYRKPRKGSSPITKFLIFGVIIGLIGYVYFVFSSNTPIYDVAIGSEVNATTYYPDEPLDYVIASDGILYISYSARDSLYETVYVTVYNNTDNLLVESMNTSIDYEDQVGYFSVDHNWTVGSYQITFEIDGEVVYTYDFEVELY